MRARSSLLFALFFALAPSATARAQQQGFALNRFEPAERGSEWFAQDTLDLRGRVRPMFGVALDFARKPLVAYGADGAERAAIVRNQLFVHVGASLVLVDRLRLAFNVPIAVFQDGSAVTVQGVTFSPPDKAAVGDVRLSADVRLLGQYGTPFVAALGAQLFVPSGSRDQWTGDGRVRVVPRLQVAGDIGPFAYAARVGAAYRALSEELAGSKVGSELTFGASAGLRFANRKLLIGPEVFGTTVFSAAFERKTTPLEVIGSAHYTAGDFRVGAGFGPGLARGFGAPAWRGLLELAYVPAIVEETAPAPPDRDGDGILDARDACPNEKGSITNDPTTHGCPPRDDDGDGITNAQDACPRVSGVASTDPTKHGCPSDKDGDSIIDAEDACAEVQGVKSDDPTKNGCPPDQDGDGIADGDDACREVKGVASNDPAKNGCPPDTDGDGIIDAEDACLDTAGPKNADPKKNGCPAAAIVAGKIQILQQVKFKTNSAEILSESDEILTAVAKILIEHPELKKVKVEGHTDNKGGTAHNLALSKSRAASVAKWLTTKGKIEVNRLSSEGFGETVPIDTNDTEDGRQNNRRVEFKILEADAPAVKP